MIAQNRNPGALAGATGVHVSYDATEPIAQDDAGQAERAVLAAAWLKQVRANVPVRSIAFFVSAVIAEEWATGSGDDLRLDLGALAGAISIKRVVIRSGVLALALSDHLAVRQDAGRRDPWIVRPIFQADTLSKARLASPHCGEGRAWEK